MTSRGQAFPQDRILEDPPVHGPRFLLCLPLSPSLRSAGAGTGGAEGIGSRLTPGAPCALLMWGCITGAAGRAPLPPRPPLLRSGLSHPESSGTPSTSHRAAGPEATRLPAIQTRGTGRGAKAPGAGPGSPGKTAHEGRYERWGVQTGVPRASPRSLQGPSVSPPNQCHTFHLSFCFPPGSVVQGRGPKESGEVMRPCVQGCQVPSPAGEAWRRCWVG